VCGQSTARERRRRKKEVDLAVTNSVGEYPLRVFTLRVPTVCLFVYVELDNSNSSGYIFVKFGEHVNSTDMELEG